MPSKAIVAFAPSEHRSSGTKSRIFGKVDWLSCLWHRRSSDSELLGLVDERPPTPYPHSWTYYATGTTYLNARRNSTNVFSGFELQAVPPVSSPRPVSFPALPFPPVPVEAPQRPSHPRHPRRSHRTSMDLADFTIEEGANEPLTPETFPGVLRTLDDTLGHIPYAVTGTAALALWGYDEAVLTHVSILCPVESKDVIKSWTRASGGLISTEPGQIGIRTDDGLLRKVQVKYIARGFDRLNLESIPIPPVPNARRPDSLLRASPTRVVQTLSLPCLLDQLVQDYCANYTAPGGFRRRIELANAIFWILECIRDGGEEMEKLSQENVPNVVKPEFWDRFHNLYPKGIEAFREAGLPVLGGKPLLSAIPPIRDGDDYDTPGPWNGPVYINDSSPVATVREASAVEDLPTTEYMAAHHPWGGPLHANTSSADTTFTAFMRAAQVGEAEDIPEAASASRRDHHHNMSAPLPSRMPSVQEEGKEFRPQSSNSQPKRPWWRRMGLKKEERPRGRTRERRHDDSRRSSSGDSASSRGDVDDGKFANLFHDNMGDDGKFADDLI